MWCIGTRRWCETRSSSAARMPPPLPPVTATENRTRSMRRVDRASASDARFVLEGLIPDAASRLRWLGLLADAMVAAHEIHPASWAVTLFDAGLRLNVGQIETVVFSS